MKEANFAPFIVPGVCRCRYANFFLRGLRRYPHETEFSGYQRYEPHMNIFQTMEKNLIQMMFRTHEPSQYFANVSFCALILQRKCGMVSGPLDGPIRVCNPGHRLQKIQSGNCHAVCHSDNTCLDTLMHQVSEFTDQKKGTT